MGFALLTVANKARSNMTGQYNSKWKPEQEENVGPSSTDTALFALYADIC